MTGKLTVECTGWKPIRKNSLLGFATVRIVEMGFTIVDAPVNTSHGKVWASPPSRPWVEDGAVVFGNDGKPKYSPLIKFDKDEVKDAFSRAVVDAVRRFDPNALAPAEVP